MIMASNDEIDVERQPNYIQTKPYISAVVWIIIPL